ncbi:MAG: hypothetical protein ACT4PO_04575 [Actinomycetota bacterium]
MASTEGSKRSRVYSQPPASVSSLWLDILVVADPNTQSGKARQARKFGTRIMAEAAFWRAIGVQAD